MQFLKWVPFPVGFNYTPTIIFIYGKPKNPRELISYIRFPKPGIRRIRILRIWIRGLIYVVTILIPPTGPCKYPFSHPSANTLPPTPANTPPRMTCNFVRQVNLAELVYDMQNVVFLANFFLDSLYKYILSYNHKLIKR